MLRNLGCKITTIKKNPYVKSFIIIFFFKFGQVPQRANLNFKQVSHHLFLRLEITTEETE